VQGKGLASALMNPMIEDMKKKSIPVHLETANPDNVEIYKKKGFNIFHKIKLGNNTFYWMRR
jgi:predicted acetyltransferase